jgi:hypothetical protein
MIQPYSQTLDLEVTHFCQRVSDEEKNRFIRFPPDQTLAGPFGRFEGSRRQPRTLQIPRRFDGDLTTTTTTTATSDF